MPNFDLALQESDMSKATNQYTKLVERIEYLEDQRRKDDIKFKRLSAKWINDIKALTAFVIEQNADNRRMRLDESRGAIETVLSEHSLI